MSHRRAKALRKGLRLSGMDKEALKHAEYVEGKKGYRPMFKDGAWSLFEIAGTIKLSEMCGRGVYQRIKRSVYTLEAR